MSTTSEVIGVLESITLSLPVAWVHGPEMPAQPALVGAVTPGTGILGLMQGGLDIKSFSVRLRGPDNQLGVPEGLLAELRAAFERDMVWPREVGEHGWLWCTQSGTTLVVPGSLRTSRRAEAVATFSYEVSTDF